MLRLRQVTLRSCGRETLRWNRFYFMWREDKEARVLKWEATSNLTLQSFDKKLYFYAYVSSRAGNIFRRAGVKVKIKIYRVTLYFIPPLEIVLVVRQVVIAITLTPVRHKRHMQFLTSAPTFRGGGQLIPWRGLCEPCNVSLAHPVACL